MVFHGCAVLTWAHTHTELKTAEAELYGIGSGEIERSGTASFLPEWQHQVVLLFATYSQNERVADFMTKAMTREKLMKFARALNLLLVIFFCSGDSFVRVTHWRVFRDKCSHIVILFFVVLCVCCVLCVVVVGVAVAVAAAAV